MLLDDYATLYNEAASTHLLVVKTAELSQVYQFHQAD